MSHLNTGDHSIIIRRKEAILRLWESPPFDETVTWTLFIDIAFNALEDRHPLIRKVTGGKYTDLRFSHHFDLKFKDILQEDVSHDSRTRVEDVWLSRSQFAQIDIFRKISIQIRPKYTGYSGLDGSYFGLQTWNDGAEFAPMKLEWWSNGPGEWHDVTS